MSEACAPAVPATYDGDMSLTATVPFRAGATPSETTAMPPEYKATVRGGSFEHRLAHLQEETLRMGTLVLGMVHDSLSAVRLSDSILAEGVIAADDRADEMHDSIERTCIRVLALYSPLARDLRLVGTILKIVTDLERIGDHAVDIAKTARRMAEEPLNVPTQRLAVMQRHTEWMVRESLQAYVDRDLDLAAEVIRRDEVVDINYDRLFTEVLELMERDVTRIKQGTWIIHVGRYLERIADHAVNVAERLHYVETGERRKADPPKSAS